MSEYNCIDLHNLNESILNTNIRISGRVHNVRKTGAICFIILRDQLRSLQAVTTKKNIGPERFKDLYSIQNESFVELYGQLTQLPDTIARVESTYYKNFEFKISDFKVISNSHKIPFPLDDANQLDEDLSDRNKVLLNTRLNNRSYELRTPVNNCIFKLQSGVTELFREYLRSQDFMEIFTPKLIGTSSESGSSVFPVNYFDKKAFLAQSPQLYKQMCINSDFKRVFEIGPVFRAENCISHRHLCEFIGLDVEMALTTGKDYYELINMLWNILSYIFDNLKTKYAEQLNYVKTVHKYDDLIYSKEPLIVNFKDGVKYLQDAGFKQDLHSDLSTENEKQLGRIIKQKYGYDIFVLDKYPTSVRPFYTMPCEDDKLFSNSFDVIMRGEEIISGSQRIHDYDMLTENIKNNNLSTELLSDYLESFAAGSRPHAGFGMGLARIIMLFLSLGNVRRTSMYPRDPNRITP
jgi:aspartyl-tRNA synthetase